MGKVFLVGAGPGDPELLTCKALRILQSSGVVLHDSLVSKEILRLIPSNAERIDVGKRHGYKLLTQRDINSLLVSAAARHEVVVRLKGGDPLLFGRAAEEIEALRDGAIEFEIIPGNFRRIRSRRCGEGSTHGSGIGFKRSVHHVLPLTRSAATAPKHTNFGHYRCCIYAWPTLRRSIQLAAASRIVFRDALRRGFQSHAAGSNHPTLYSGQPGQSFAAAVACATDRWSSRRSRQCRACCR